MALSVTSNFAISAGYAANNMKGSQSLMGKSINRISSGLKAFKPNDDLSSFMGGTKLKGDSSGYSALSTGVQNAAARLNMADSVMADAQNALIDLKTQAINYQSASTDEQTAMSTSFTQMITSLTAMSGAQYKGGSLFDSTGTINVYYSWGSSATPMNVSGSGVMDWPSSISSVAINDGGASAQAAIDDLTTRRAAIGGNLSALEQISNYLSDAAASADAAYTAVTEVDMAKEMTAYVKNNIQSQAAQAMVAQANQGLAQVLNLLQV